MSHMHLSPKNGGRDLGFPVPHSANPKKGCTPNRRATWQTLGRWLCWLASGLLDLCVAPICPVVFVILRSRFQSETESLDHHKHRWPFGKIDGPAKWKIPHLNQRHLCLIKLT